MRLEITSSPIRTCVGEDDHVEVCTLVVSESLPEGYHADVREIRNRIFVADGQSQRDGQLEVIELRLQIGGELARELCPVLAERLRQLTVSHIRQRNRCQKVASVAVQCDFVGMFRRDLEQIVSRTYRTLVVYRHAWCL